MLRSQFSLMWSMPPSADDWRNLALSKVSRILLIADFCDYITLRKLANMGVRVTARLREGEYATEQQRRDWASKISVMARNGVDTVIIGCEPDHPFDLKWGSKDWGNQEAWAHAKHADAMRSLLVSTGVRIVTAGLTCSPDRITEGGLPEPGRQTWLEETRYLYNDGGVYANGAHLYLMGWSSEVDWHRCQHLLKQFQTEHHRLIYIDEVGALIVDDVKKARCYVQIATKLLNNQRLCAFTPFVANGTGNGWNARYILHDPAAYALIGEFISGRDFPLDFS